MNESGQESSLSDFEAARSSLRQRWELASVLNFFKVFEPVIESNLKISAEEIETALIQPNKSLTQLHIALLKGIPPVNKNLKDPDAWVVSLSKKLIMWWPWVAEGDFPLTADKGAEMATYKELDPTIRLVILKALCEIRADQHDVVSYINEAKNNNEMSTFRKTNIGEDGKGTSYWCDGNEVIGFRLYKEINTFKKNAISFRWETLATNLEEFQKVVDEYSSSKLKLEVAVSAVIEADVMPALNKLEKKRQRAMQKKKQEERIVNNFIRVGTTRACRRSKPISYTFDEYDKVMDEAIRETKKRKTKEEERSKKRVTAVKEDSEQDDDDDDQDNEYGKANNEGITETKKIKDKEEEKSKKKVTVVKDDSEEDENESTESDNSKLQTEDVSEDSSEDSGEETHDDNEENNGNHSSEDEEEEEEEEEEEDEENNGNDSSEGEIVEDSETENGGIVGKKRKKDDDIEEMRNFGTKKRLRQRPNRNSALESAIVCDTEDESSENSDS